MTKCLVPTNIHCTVLECVTRMALMSDKHTSLLHISVARSGATDLFYYTVYCITLNSNCEAQRASKLWKDILEDRFRNQN